MNNNYRKDTTPKILCQDIKFLTNKELENDIILQKSGRVLVTKCRKKVPNDS